MLIPRLLLSAVLLLSACSAPVTAVTDYVQFKRGASQASVAKMQLNPAYQYLLVTVKGKSFLMARGAVDQSVLGPIEVWYSGSKEVIRIQNGRIIAASGTPTEWSDVRISAQPGWDEIHSSISLERRRDVMPGYLFGLEDVLTVGPINRPRSAFFGAIPPNVHWFREVSSGTYALPASIYAVQIEGHRSEVIYGEQCLSKDLCFSWQRWPTRT